MDDLSVSCVLSDSTQKELPSWSLFSSKLTKTDFPPQLLPFICSYFLKRNSLPFNHQGKQSAWSKWTVSLLPNLPHLFNNTAVLCALWKYTTGSSYTPFPRSPCVNIYHFNINCSSSQILPHLLLIYFQVIHESYTTSTCLCVFMWHSSLLQPNSVTILMCLGCIPPPYFLPLSLSLLLSATFLNTIWLIDTLLRPIMQM